MMAPKTLAAAALVVLVVLAIAVAVSRRKKPDSYLVFPYYPGDSEYRGNPYALSEANARA